MKRVSNITDFFHSRFLLLCAILCFALVFFLSEKKTPSARGDFGFAAKKFVGTLHTKEKHAEKELEKLADKVKRLSYKELFSPEHSGEYYEKLFEREGLVFLIFENDTLRFWTDNTVAVDNVLSKNNFDGKIVKLPNGWFAVEKFSVAEKKFFALILLKREYAYQNTFLANEFQKDFDIPNDADIKIHPVQTEQNEITGTNTFNYDIYEAKGDYLCTLVFHSADKSHSFVFYFFLLLNILGFVFTILFLQSEVTSQADKIGKGWAVFLLVITVVALRYLTLLIKFPQQFYETKFFSPEIYGDASSIWLDSLGNLLINALLVFYLTWYFHRTVHPTSTSRLSVSNRESAINRKNEWLIWIFLLALLFFISRIINYIFSGLISNSHIPFTLNALFSQNVYTVVGLVIMGLFLFSYFLLLDKVADILKEYIHERKKYLAVLLTSVALFFIVSFYTGAVDLILVCWSLILFLFLLVIKQKKNPYSFTTVVVLLLIVSFFSAHLILKFTGQKEEESRKIFAQKLAAEQDPLAEHLFAEVEASISTDTSLISLLTKKLSYGNTVLQQHAQVPVITNELFKRKLIAKYFSGYWEKYEIHITVFDTSCFAILPNPLPEKNNIAYFEDVISSEGTPTESSNLFYLQNSSCRLSYLARLPLVSLQDSSMRVGNLFIEFDSRIISEEAGFPELMLDRKIGVETELGKDYSYAKYKDGELLFYHGKFPYSLSAESFLQDGSNEKKFPHFRLLQINNYNHLIYMPDSSSMVVVSKKEEGILASITAFSYLFAFFSLFLMLLLLLRLLVSHSKIHIYSFSNRIQFALVSIILFSLLFFSAGTVFYIQQQYDRQSRQSVRDKMVSALVEASQELGSEEKLQLSKSEFFSYTLKRMSNIFLSDLNLYDKEGNLIASSQKKLFDEGLLSHKMNPQSYYHLVVKQDIDFVQEEKIGRLKYLSAYSSLRNDSGELLGYLNIPYFARQSELEKEISTILSTIINIYVLLFVISIILALALSEYFTRPLKLIQEKLGKIKLGKANEPIEWKSQDEIGSLVNEYNRMIEELHKSAMLLAKSERESAWREMAKQVAHEIKNPLTPMKLSIQHLQRIWKNKDENMDEKIQQLTQTIVEQIEALSVIASEFASFAKMPVTVNEKINLKTILENAIALFRDSTDAEISFHTVQDEAFIYADKEQMLRVCNNLLKNALQAIPENKHGKIDVSLEKKDNAFLFKVKDNGIGISEEQISKIFTPNFTTKSGGMGLGLAMVKSIVETFGGKIWFETSRGKGTTFFVSLHEYKDNS